MSRYVLRKFRVLRIKELINTITEFLEFGRIWVVDGETEKGYYYKFEFGEWIRSILWHSEGIVKGYWQGYELQG